MTLPQSGTGDPERAATAAAASFAELAPRERQCLRLVFEFKTSKEIERELGIAKSTVDGYLAEAVRKLGARDRRHAAVLFAAHEGRRPQAESGGDPARVVAVPVHDPVPAPQGWPGDWRSALPLRRKDARHNLLRPRQRLFWIVLSAAVMMIGFGMLVSGLAVLTDILAATGLLRR